MSTVVYFEQIQFRKNLHVTRSIFDKQTVDQFILTSSVNCNSYQADTLLILELSN